jgi:hypothetical protein
MYNTIRALILVIAAVGVARFLPASPEKEFLTGKEIERLQDAQAIDLRVLVYMDAAERRLKAAEDRLTGKEPEQGDPLEFFTPEDLIDGYDRILQSVMTNLDAAFDARRDPRQLNKALKTLKKSTERASGPLDALKKLAEEKKKEELWNLVNKGIDLTGDVHDGAEEGLLKLSGNSKEKSGARSQKPEFK